MKIDPERNVTITLPIWMLEKLIKMKPTLAMFRDDEDVQVVMDIIDAMHAGAVEYIQQEDGELLEYLSDIEDDDGYILPPEKKDKEDNGKDN
jgi:hypothetical protein